MPMYPGVLIKYLVLNLICYLLALFIVRKWWLVAEVPITGFIATAVLGAVLSAIIVDVPHMLSHLGGGQLSAARVAESFRRFIYFVVLNCYVTVPIMAVLYWISSVLGAPRGRYGSSDPGGV
jgi:hypothetical protein